MGTDAAKAQGLAGRVVRGGTALVIRQVLIHGLSLLGGLVLLRFLQPEDLAVYAVITVLRDWYGTLSDLGLGTTLIQQSAPIRPEQQQGLFCLQCLVSLVVALALTCADPLIVAGFGWPTQARGVLTLVGWGLLFVPLRWIPAILLQRELLLDRFAFVEVSETLSFIAVALVGAAAGGGSWALGWGMVARFACGAGVANLLQRWPIGWRWPWKSELRWRLGLGYQAGLVLTLLKESTLPVLLGLLLNARAIGLLKWALTIANLPLVLPLSLDRLTFPLMSRMAQQPEQFRLWVVRTMQLNALVVWWLSALLVVLAEPLVHTLFGNQWLPALPYLYGLLPIALVYAPLLAVIQAHQALAQPEVNFWLNCSWLIVLWPLSWLLVPQLGAMGFVIASVSINVASLVVIVRASRIFKISVFQHTWPAATAGLLAAATGYGALRVLSTMNLPLVLLVALAMSAVYAGGLWLGWRDLLSQVFAALRAEFRRTRPIQEAGS
ncbi:oligosaccharide flippase family protein [Gloeobacter kilaueensis]|uniref:Polysaccharide biosynthesis protein n=1 Tax=Gloeobacter kilaueensis (strain ATCC BAA-2537 / CCAP 1431/1 / ULC 316 / JS1) TaxID=1183438 RepID=U5QMZ0_GLOK1|nr:oligosaccharide flippase family protein [Gloeobacter kilaueensis]AGY60327.1 polysaccharide biosynthesis protein [Gloeobacter kilaueensis JS1]